MVFKELYKLATIEYPDDENIPSDIIYALRMGFQIGAVKQHEKDYNWLKENTNLTQTSIALTNLPEPGKFKNVLESFKESIYDK